jgi:hypothetical protein
MKQKFLIVPVFSLIMITGCSEQNSDTVTDYKGERIHLQTNIGAITRGEGVIDGTDKFPGDELSVSFIRLDKGETYESEAAAIVGTIKTGGVLTFTEGTVDAYYPADKSQTFQLIGWYPQGGRYSTTDEGDGIVTFADLDGETDVLATKLVSGSYNSASKTFQKIVFEHLLSQIIVKVIAQNIDGQTTWGDLKSISIKDRKQSYTLKLPSTEGNSPTIVFSGAVDNLDLVKKNPADGSSIKGSDGATEYDDSNVLQIPVTSPSALAGYALIAPTIGDSEEFTLLLTTSTKTEVPITLLAQKFEKGKSYTITLTFAQYLKIGVTSSDIIKGWGSPEAITTPPIRGYAGFDGSSDGFLDK